MESMYMTIISLSVMRWIKKIDEIAHARGKIR